MRERLAAMVTELLTRIGLLPEEPAPQAREALESTREAEIEFWPLSPQQAAALGSDTALVCPVTRQSLTNDAPLYLCRDCNTAYSAEGWLFLRETDKGRCCQCRHIGSVLPYRDGGDARPE
jgi:hypothetical protein